METTLRNSIESIKAYGKQIAQTGLAKCNTTAAFNAGANDAKAGKANSPTLPLPVELATPAETDDALTKYAATLWNQEQLFKQGYNEVYQEAYDQGYKGIPVTLSAQLCNGQEKGYALFYGDTLNSAYGGGYYGRYAHFTWKTVYDNGYNGIYTVTFNFSVSQDTDPSLNPYCLVLPGPGYDTEIFTDFITGEYVPGYTDSFDVSGITSASATYTTQYAEPKLNDAIIYFQDRANNTNLSASERKKGRLFTFLLKYYGDNLTSTKAYSSTGESRTIDPYLNDPEWHTYWSGTLRLTFEPSTMVPTDKTLSIINKQTCTDYGTITADTLTKDILINTQEYSPSIEECIHALLDRYSYSGPSIDALKHIYWSGGQSTDFKIVYTK